MKKILNSTFWNHWSIVLFSVFPVAILLPLKSALAIAFIVIQIFIFLANRKNNFRLNGSWLPILQSLPFLLYGLSLLYSSNTTYGSNYMVRTLVLFIFPWLFFLNRNLLQKKTTITALNFYSTAITLFSVLVISVLYFDHTFQLAASSPDSYYIIRTQLEVVSGLHPTYFSMVLGLALLHLNSLLKKQSNALKTKLWLILAIAILVFGLGIAASKMALFATFIGSIVIWAQNLSLKKAMALLTMAAGLAFLFVFTVTPINQRFKALIKASSQSNIDPNNPDSVRKIIVKGESQVIKENFWWGTGIGDQQDELDKAYKKLNSEIAMQRHFNTHNQYLQVWLSTGFFSFLVFVLLILAHFIIAICNKNTFHLSVILLFAMVFLTENVLARQDGIFLFSFFSTLLAYGSFLNNKQTVFINGRFKTQALTGVQRFSIEVSEQLQMEPCTYKLLVQQNPESNFEIRLSFLKGTLWEQITLPLYLRFLGSPLLLNLGNSAPLYYSNQAITIHDVAFKENPEWFSKLFVVWYNFMIPKIIYKSSIIFTVSQFSKSEIVKWFKVKPQKIEVVYNGFPAFTKSKVVQKPLVNPPYYLSVGTFSKRKNQATVVEAFIQSNIANMPLVLAGNFNEDVFSEQPELLKKIKDHHQIVLVHTPSDQDLASLYQNAACCIYLPLYEGFGIPVLEALAYNKPIIVSDIPVFKELFQNAVIFSNPNNIANIRDQLTKFKSENKVQDPEPFYRSLYSYKKAAFKINKRLNFAKA